MLAKMTLASVGAPGKVHVDVGQVRIEVVVHVLDVVQRRRLANGDVAGVLDHHLDVERLMAGFFV